MPGSLLTSSFILRYCSFCCVFFEKIVLIKIIFCFCRFEFARLHPVLRNSKKVVSMSLYGNSTTLNMGAVRNAQLLPVYFPGWTLRIYAYLGNFENPSDPRSVEPSFGELIVPGRIIDTLKNLGAKIIPVAPSGPWPRPELWSYEVVNDDDVQFFVIRKAEHRISSRDFEAVDDFVQKSLRSKASPNNSGVTFHCMRDRHSHRNLSIVPGLWGGSVKAMTKVFGKGAFLKNVTDLINSDKSISEAEILDRLLWQNYRHLFHCHDSVSCQEWAPMSDSFPNYSSPQRHWETLGVEYDRYEMPSDYSIQVELEAGLLVQGLCRNMSSVNNETNVSSTVDLRVTRAQNLTTRV